jgi:thermitase
VKARRIIIVLIMSILLAVGLGATPFLSAASPETPVQTTRVYLNQPPGQSVVSASSETFADTGGKFGASEAYSTNDPYLSKQWALREIPALPITPGSPGVLIAILDTGIDQQHEDLAGKVVASVNFSGSPTASDLNGHGTHIAGIIAAAANNGIGIAGVTPNSRLLNVKVADDNGTTWASAVAEGIVWATDNGAKVINMSLILPSSSPALEEAIDYAWSKGVVLTAGAGNNIKSIPVYPAAYPEVIAVAATDPGGGLWSRSNCGDWVDAYAPGVEIYSTLPGNHYGYQSGTSMATAYVSAVAASALSIVTDTNGDGLVNDEVITLLETLFARLR